MAARQPRHVTEAPYPYPVPEDDGAADHLVGIGIPNVVLSGTDGTADLGALPGTAVLYCFTMHGAPDLALPTDWDAIPGAHGSTPQSVGYRDLVADLGLAGADHVHGIGAQPVAELAEARERLGLPFALLSDADLTLAHALRLPTFTAGGRTLLHRVTMIVRGGTILHARYPVHPPADDAAAVLDWLRANGPG